MSAIAVTLVICMAPGAHADPNEPVANRSSSKTQPTARMSIRFADKDTQEVPDFQKHVMPLLGRMGCNGRACHGSFQGRGGFQLSLFGYDFSTDHEALLADNTGRVDTDDIDESLILAKPIDADYHEGGKRMDLDSWQYRALRKWIAEGASFEKQDLQELQALKVEPAEMQFTKGKQTVQLKAIAYWADGTAEDVTDLCRFSSNNDAVAEIDEDGLVTSGEAGDTHVVVYYDNAVTPVPVLQRITTKLSDHSESIAKRVSKQPIDQLVKQKLDKLGIVPSGQCTDAEYIRRVSLDITGMMPSADAVKSFLADESPNKREKLVEQLLESPGYSAWWATRLSDWTGNNEAQLNNVLPVRNVAGKLWFTWMQKRLEDNMPYDKIVEGIVTANTSEPGESYEQFCKNMTQICSGDLDQFANRESMPYYWARRNFQKPEDRAIGFAYTFLGVRIECAQCHKHPFDQWSKQDFDDFAKLFAPIRAGNANIVQNQNRDARQALLDKITEGKKLDNGQLRREIYNAARDGKVVPFGELLVNTRGMTDQQKRQRAAAKRKGRKLPPVNIPTGKILGAEQELKLDADPRPALMAWLRDPENPYFAKAIVNRVWDNYFGIGIVNPTDDMNLANPPSNAALLDHLASEFIAHDFDLKWLHREIVLSDTYQRSAETNATNAADEENFSRHMPRRLPAEVVYDMVMLATGSSQKASQMRGELTSMAIADGTTGARGGSQFALEVFGKSIRESNCDCDRSDSPSLLQSIYLRNDQEMFQRIADRNGWVAEVCKDLGVKGPNGTGNSQQAVQARQAEGIRRQIVLRVAGLSKQLAKLPENRRESALERAKVAYRKQTAKLTKVYEVPSFKDLLKNPKSWTELVEKSASSGSVDEGKIASLEGVVQETYLRTLSRYPDDEEVGIAVEYIRESESPAKGIEGLVWALVNTKEFIISH